MLLSSILRNECAWKRPCLLAKSAYESRFRGLIYNKINPLAHTSQEVYLITLRNPLFGLDDLTVLVVATVRAHAMRKLHLAALRANAAGGSIDAVMGATTLVGADAAHSLFWYCHLYYSFYMRFVSRYGLYLCKHAKRYSSKAYACLQAAFSPSPYLRTRLYLYTLEAVVLAIRT